MVQDIIVYDINGNSINNLVQWDSDVYIYLSGAEIDSAYQVHFFNSTMDKALVVDSTFTSGKLRVKIPNNLLIQPYIITGYVNITKNDQSRCMYGFKINIRKKPKPLDFVYTESDDYVSIEKIRNECKEWAQSSQSWAVGGTGMREGEDADNAKYYSQQSKSFVNAASVKASEAANSASDAEVSKTNAANSEAVAAESAIAAENAKTAAQTAKSAAEDAKTAAQASATAAHGSAIAAENAKTAAQTAKSAAEDASAAVVASAEAAQAAAENAGTLATAAAESAAAAEEAKAAAESVAVKTPYVGSSGNWMVWDQDTGDFVDSGKKAEGPHGLQGNPGKTAYQYAVEGGYTGTEAEFSEKLQMEFLPTSGGTMSGQIAMSGNRVTGLAAPEVATDAVTKAYVDAGFAPAGYGLGGACTAIPNNAALDGYTSTGFYQWGGDNTDANKPFYAGSMLTVNRSDLYIHQLAFRDDVYNCEMCIRKNTNGVWGAWEWVNPTMAEGVEYRTIERYHGKPVYTKIVNTGVVVNGTVINLGLPNVYKIVRQDAAWLSGGIVLPFGADEGTNLKIMLFIDSGEWKCNVICGTKYAGRADITLQVWYTKD